MEKEKLRLLIVSDQVIDRLYSPNLRTLFPDVDLVLSCGDLPYYYLEFILDTLNVPLFFVHGNHDPAVEISARGDRRQPWGAENLHRRVIRQHGLLFLGFEGSIRYSGGRYQSSQSEVWRQVLLMVPRLLWNRLVHGRYVDILVTHSPAFEVGDAEDPAHVGFRAYRWLIEKFRPRYHFHGHVHIYEHQSFSPEVFAATTVVNACPYRIVEIVRGGKGE